MAMTLNGVAIKPSDAPKQKSKIGKTQIAANGNRTFILRVTSGGAPIYKSQWALKWEKVGEAVRTVIEGLANVTTTMTYVDINGASYTVQTEADAYSDSVAFIGAGGTPYYNVSLMIYEA